MILRPPEPTGASLADRYLSACRDAQGHTRIANVITELAVLMVDELCLPVTINAGGERSPTGEANSYVVSPLTAYGDYALVELERLGRLWLFWPFHLLLRGMRGLLQMGRLDRILQINNWLLSTNPYPQGWTGRGLAAVLPALIRQYPDHAIGLRSLNELNNGALIRALIDIGFIPVPSRQVYLFDGRAPSFMQRHNTRIDQRLLAKTPLQQVAGSDFDAADFARAEQLYALLYLDKYSRLNSQYSAAWLNAGRDQGWLQLCGLRAANGELLGVVGWFELDEVITAPIVGYDTHADPRLGLYRLLTGICLTRAAQAGKLLNFSSGAAHFKRLRGGQAAIEYSLVYVRHLSPARRWLWRVLAALLNVLAVPLMRRLQL